MIEAGNEPKKKWEQFISAMSLTLYLRYANDPVYSDDDMEANASDVLREEKRRYIKKKVQIFFVDVTCRT